MVFPGENHHHNVRCTQEEVGKQNENRAVNEVVTFASYLDTCEPSGCCDVLYDYTDARPLWEL